MAEEIVTGNIANIRYGHLPVPWDAPLSFGVQAFIEYNGLIINDRYQSDLVRTVGITGLDDAEIRDSREPRPSAHGEFVYDSFYSGRNLVLTGFFESSTLGVLKSFEKELKAAFAPLVENYLKFRWFDIYDSFDEPQTIYPYNALTSGPQTGNYSALIGNISNLKVENSQLSWVASGNNYVLRTAEKRTFCDCQMTMMCIPGSTGVKSTFGFIGSVKNEGEFYRLLYNQNNGLPTLSIETIVGGEVNELSTLSLPSAIRPILGQMFWIRGRKEGNLLTMEFWNKQPEQTALPALFTTANLTGSDADIFGDKVMGQVGFGGEQKDILWRFDEYKVESLYPGDVAFKARKTTNLAIKDEQTNLQKFKRAYQITLKTSDFRAFSAAQARKSLVPSINAALPAAGRKYKRKYPLKYRGPFIPSSVTLEERILSVNNRGSVFVEPILVLYGPFENIGMFNLTNNMVLVWNGSIKENDYLSFDCKEKKLTNSLGENKKEGLLPNLLWIKLEPMWNDLYLVGKGFSSSTKFVCYYKHGYM